MIIHLLRHGQVDGPAALYGHTDVALSDKGLHALRAATASLTAPDLIISSPLQRCHRFALESAEHHHCPLMVEPDLREMDFGSWDGVPYREDSPNWPAMCAFWQAPDIHTPPHGESLQQLQARVCDAWHRLLTHDVEQLWVIAHGGVIRLIIAEVLALDWRNPKLYSTLNIGYASRSCLHYHAQSNTTRIESIGVLPSIK